MTYIVGLSPEAEEQLIAIEQYIAEAAASNDIAERYVDGIVSFCENLVRFPERGQR